MLATVFYLLTENLERYNFSWEKKSVPVAGTLMLEPECQEVWRLIREKE